MVWGSQEKKMRNIFNFISFNFIFLSYSSHSFKKLEVKPAIRTLKSFSSNFYLLPIVSSWRRGKIIYNFYILWIGFSWDFILSFFSSLALYIYIYIFHIFSCKLNKVLFLSPFICLCINHSMPIVHEHSSMQFLNC